MRAFVDKALQHPEAGGHFYAHRVLQECEGVRSGTDVAEPGYPPYTAGEDSREYLKTAQAAEWLRRRCADFLPEETAHERLRSIWSAARHRDPLVQAAQNLFAAFEKSMQNPDSRQERKTALAEVLKTGDPLLLQEIGLRLALDSQNGKRGYFIGGAFHPLDAPLDVGFAIALLPCGLGLACDQNDFQTRLQCATGAECAADRFETTRRMLQARPGAYGDVMAIHETMLTAARQAHSDFFTRPDQSTTLPPPQAERSDAPPPSAATAAPAPGVPSGRE